MYITLSISLSLVICYVVSRVIFFLFPFVVNVFGLDTSFIIDVGFVFLAVIFAVNCWVIFICFLFILTVIAVVNCYLSASFVVDDVLAGFGFVTAVKTFNIPTNVFI